MQLKRLHAIDADVPALIRQVVALDVRRILDIHRGRVQSICDGLADDVRDSAVGIGDEHQFRRSVDDRSGEVDAPFDGGDEVGGAS